MEPGTPLPDLGVTLADGSALALPSLSGAPAVIYFYPKADTPGCTREAQDFSALADEFAAAGATVIGVSKDTTAKLGKFAGKYDLSVRLAADESGAVCNAFGVWGEKSMYGKTYMGMERSTFVIDADGNVAKIMRKVKPDEHADAVLAALA